MTPRRQVYDRIDWQKSTTFHKIQHTQTHKDFKSRSKQNVTNGQPVLAEESKRAYETPQGIDEMDKIAPSNHLL